MQQKVFVFDPTADDALSKVRGVGRYLQVLKENFPEWTFTNNLLAMKQFSHEVIFINPFINFSQPPHVKKRVANKQIGVIHDLIPLKYPQHFPLGVRGKLNVFLNKQALKNYDFIITDSQASRTDIVNILKIPENKIKVIYPVLPKLFQETVKKKETGSYAVYVGDATWNKNLVNIAKAIQEANVTCVFIGKVFAKSDTYEVSHLWQKELKEFLELTKDDRRFIFPGFVSDKQLLEYYRQARVNLLLSRDEGFGFSYLEAGSQGTPSLLSDIPVLREIAKTNAVFVDPENVNEIANKLIEIYFSPKKQKELGAKVKKRASNFSSEKFRRDFLRLV